MTYVIEDNIPIPAGPGDPSPERLALDKLQPGQSVLFPKDKASRARNAAANKHGKNKAWNYTAQKQDDGSLRIWRVEEKEGKRGGGSTLKGTAAYDTDEEWTEYFHEEMKQVSGDTEAVHRTADCLLIEFVEWKGYEKLAAAWDEVDKWYS